jgi:hypothetical protein
VIAVATAATASLFTFRPSSLRADPRYVAGPMRRFLVAISPARSLVAGPMRRLLIPPVENAMPQSNDIGPIDSNETVTITWDFGGDLLPGVTINSVVESSCIVYGGTADAGASGRLQGSAIVADAPVPPYGSGRASSAAMQQFKGGVAGAYYSCSCLVATSDNQQLNKYVHFVCQNSNA